MCNIDYVLHNKNELHFLSDKNKIHVFIYSNKYNNI